MGERQMFPVQTTRMEAIDRPESSSRARPEVPIGLPYHAEDVHRGDGAVSEDGRLAVGEVHHGRGDARQRLVLAQVDGDGLAEQLDQLVARRGCRGPRAVGAGHGQRPGPLQDRQGQQVTGPPEPDGAGVAAQGPLATALGPRDDHGEGPGPEPPGQGSGPPVHEPDRRRVVRGNHQDREGQVAGTALRIEQPRRGVGAVRPGSDPVHRVGGKDDQPSGQRLPGRLVDVAQWTGPPHRTDPATTRSRPARSRTTRTSWNPPSRRIPRTSWPWVSAISTTRAPPGRSHRRLSSASRRWTVVPPSRASRKCLQRNVHQDLGLGPGDEHARPHHQLEVPECLPSREVLERHARAPLAQRAPERLRLRGAQPFGSRVQPGPVRPQDLGEQDLRGGARAVHAMPLQVRGGPMQDLGGTHQGASGPLRSPSPPASCSARSFADSASTNRSMSPDSTPWTSCSFTSTRWSATRLSGKLYVRIFSARSPDPTCWRRDSASLRCCSSCCMRKSRALRYRMAFSRFWSWDRSSCISTLIPVGLWVIRTAESVVLTDCPPGPEERYTSMSRSSGRISTSTSSASGRTATVAVEVWMRPLDSVTGTRCTRWVPDSCFSFE